MTYTDEEISAFAESFLEQIERRGALSYIVYKRQSPVLTHGAVDSIMAYILNKTPKEPGLAIRLTICDHEPAPEDEIFYFIIAKSPEYMWECWQSIYKEYKHFRTTIPNFINVDDEIASFGQKIKARLLEHNFTPVETNAEVCHRLQ